MKKVFICSPYAGETMRNVVLARQHCLHAISLGFAPFAPHLLYPQFLSDELAEDRKADIDWVMKMFREYMKLERRLKEEGS